MKNKKDLSLARLRKFQKRRLHRFVKYMRTHMGLHGNHSKPLYIFACQRSGTNMLIDLFDKSLDTWVYNEGHPKAFNGMRLREKSVIDRLIKKNRCKWVVFKPLCDTHNMDIILKRNETAEAIYIYRNFLDVANSAVRHFGDHQYNMIRDIATGSTNHHWLGERLTESSLRILKDFFQDGLSFHEAAALKWYLHNKFLFDYADLERLMPRKLMILKYEDLVTDPKKHIPWLFSKLEIDYDERFITFIHHSSVSKKDPPEINRQLFDLCREMQHKLDKHYLDQESVHDA